LLTAVSYQEKMLGKKPHNLDLIAAVFFDYFWSTYSGGKPDHYIKSQNLLYVFNKKPVDNFFMIADS
jgi:hypothetical protein